MTPPEEHAPLTLSDRLQGRTGLVLALVAMGVGLLLVILFAVLLLRDNGGSDALAGPPTPAGGQLNPLTNDVVIVGLSDSTAISLTLDAPQTLQLPANSFNLQPQAVGLDGSWSPAAVGDQAGVWVYGTVVNYVIGIPDTPANRAALDTLTTEDEMILQTSGGSTLRFAFRSREVVPQNNSDVFAQNRPGVTILLYGSDNTTNRLIVRGRYIAASEQAEAGSSGGSGVVSLGQTGQVGNLQLTVTGATFQFDRPEAPAGFNFYLVDFQVENQGGTLLETGDLRIFLLDAYGNQYALNSLASQVGNNPPLPFQLNPGQAAQASTGFQIPNGLSSAQLTWVVEQPATGARLQVNIPFGEGPADNEVAVGLQQAEVSPDGASILLFGTVTNTGSGQLVIEETDVRLNGDTGTVFLLFSTNPGFPWVIDPGQTLNYSVAFQRPESTSAVFSVLAWQFQLSGLR